MLMTSLIVAFAVKDGAFALPPILGELTADGVRILCKTTDLTPHELLVFDDTGQVVSKSTRIPTKANDNSLTWKIDDLEPGRRYEYAIRQEEDGPLLATSSFTTQSLPEAKIPVSIAFASCADEKPETGEVWRRIRLEKADAIVLLGDTPYIDTTDLSVQRRRYKEFAVVPEFARLVAATPAYSTWDDHDFGLNDTDGRLPGKENSRKAFIESRPNPSAGENDQGVYTNFQVGDVEVFLLDARWFARTENSPFDSEKLTLLGKQQWEWLRKKLSASSATWKVITTGMIFNGSVRPHKHDYWANYPSELNGLYALIGELNLTGVVLMGGDIHRQRVVRHDTKAVVGYDLIEFISSPSHTKIISSANQPHPGLLYDGGNTHVWIELRSEPNALGGPILNSRILRANGKVLFERAWSLSEFTSKSVNAPVEE